MKYLENEKIRLRALEPEDLELIFAIENDTELWDLGTANFPYSKFAVRQYLNQQPQDIFQAGELRMVIEERPTNQSVGIIDLLNFSIQNKHAEIAIAIKKEHRQKRYAGNAITILETYAANILGIHQLYAKVNEALNPIASKCFASLNYKKTAVLPDWHKIQNKYYDITLLSKIIS